MVTLPDNWDKSRGHQESSKIQKKPFFIILLTPLKKNYHNYTVPAHRNKTKWHFIPHVIPNSGKYKCLHGYKMASQYK